MGAPIFPQRRDETKDLSKNEMQETPPSYYISPSTLKYITLILSIFLLPVVAGSGIWMQIIIPTIVLSVLISLNVLMHRLGKAYYYNIRPYQEASFPLPITKSRYFSYNGYDYIKTPSKCILCGKHPINKKYHLFEVHKLDRDTSKVKDYFVSCGCNKCLYTTGQSM